MIPTGSNGATFKVIINGPIRAALPELQKRAAERGLGHAALSAMATMQHWLRHDPLTLGEPLYTLNKLHMQVRVAIIPPIHVHFAVHQTAPIVFIKGVHLLTD